MDLENEIAAALKWIGWDTIIEPEARVFIKPNFTYPFYKPGVTTSPQVMEALISVLSTQTSNIIIGESDGGYHAWKAEEAFQGHNLYKIAGRYGAELVNLSKIEAEDTEVKVGSKTVRARLPSLLLREVDAFITVPVPKVHVMTRLSLAFKNQWGAYRTQCACWITRNSARRS